MVSAAIKHFNVWKQEMTFFQFFYKNVWLFNQKFLHTGIEILGSTFWTESFRKIASCIYSDWYPDDACSFQ